MSVYKKKCTFKLILFGAWYFVLHMMYCKKFIYPSKSSLQLNYYNDDTNDYLINVPGCSIPNYSKTYKIEEAKDLKNTCGPRAINVEKKTDDIIIFTIYETIRRYSNKKYSCCYQFVAPTKVKGKQDFRVLSYSHCTPFKNGTETHLKEEIIKVSCTVSVCLKHNKAKNLVIYEDIYALVKKTKIPKQIKNNKWNILILGIDTMSRTRLYTSMPNTARHLKKYKWLDYSAYQKKKNQSQEVTSSIETRESPKISPISDIAHQLKCRSLSSLDGATCLAVLTKTIVIVGHNTFPNVMSLLTGKKMSTIYKSCSAGMDRCNDMMIWSDFKKVGYITATGEDYLILPDTFSIYGYISSPTDHYLRPIFQTGEKQRGNLVCTKKKSSGKHVLDYALDFAKSYKNQRSFGMFWTNSYSHNLNSVPTLIDRDITNLFRRLYISGVFKNTFVFFLSDHGLRYGKARGVSYESYYEERLPMLFLRVPQKFRRMYVKEFKNMQINQRRLVTPYDLYLTFQNIIDKTNMTAEACPACSSIFKEISPYRTCADASVDDKWCTCHNLTSINETNSEVFGSLKLAEKQLQIRNKNIKTDFCKLCEILNIKTVLRTHTYHDQKKNNTFYVVAFTTTPGEVNFEAIISKHNNNFTMLSIETISAYNTRGSCTVKPSDRGYCVCKSYC